MKRFSSWTRFKSYYMSSSSFSWDIVEIHDYLLFLFKTQNGAGNHFLYPTVTFISSSLNKFRQVNPLKKLFTFVCTRAYGEVNEYQKWWIIVSLLGFRYKHYFCSTLAQLVLSSIIRCCTLKESSSWNMNCDYTIHVMKACCLKQFRSACAFIKAEHGKREHAEIGELKRNAPICIMLNAQRLKYVATTNSTFCSDKSNKSILGAFRLKMDFKNK